MYKLDSKKDADDVTAIIEGQHDLSMNTFATISGLRTEQFGREVFIAVLPFKDLMNFLQVFPEVQRGVVRRKVRLIKNYVLSGVEDTTLMRFFSAITVTARGNLFYSHEDHKIAIDTEASKLSVNDGQHRFFGISEAIQELRNLVNISANETSKTELRERLTALENMAIPLVLFNKISEREEKQLFHDLNNLAQKPSRNANIKLNQTDRISALARDLAESNYFIARYGVETDKNSIHGSNPNFILLATIHACIRELLWKEVILTRKDIPFAEYLTYRDRLDDTFNKIFQALPSDCATNRNRYILGKNYALKGICKFIHECRNSNIPEELIFQTIEVADWTPNLVKWSMYGATESVRGALVFAGGEGGIYATYNLLLDLLKAIDNGEIKQ